MCTILCLPTIPLDQLCFVGRLSGMVASSNFVPERVSSIIIGTGHKRNT